MTEAIGKRLPMVALPFINAAQAEHPAFQAALIGSEPPASSSCYGPNVLELHEPGTGSQRVGLFPWRLMLEALEANASRRTSQGPDLDAR